MKHISERIKQEIEKRGLSYGKLAELTGLPKSSLQRYATGSTPKIPMTAIEKIETALHMQKGTLMGWTSETPTPYNPIIHKIPVLGRISAGLPLYAEENIDGYTYTERNGGAEYFALKVNGDSMTAAKINDGDIIVVRRQPEVENGQIAVVRVGKEDATVKRFRQDGNIVQLIPQSFNSEHQMQIYDLKNTEIEIIGRVVECKTEF